jgi:hypothetical protein
LPFFNIANFLENRSKTQDNFSSFLSTPKVHLRFLHISSSREALKKRLINEGTSDRRNNLIDIIIIIIIDKSNENDDENVCLFREHAPKFPPRALRDGGVYKKPNLLGRRGILSRVRLHRERVRGRSVERLGREDFNRVQERGTGGERAVVYRRED